MELRARLRLCYGNPLSRTLVESLSPDDVPPRGFSLRSYSESGCYVYEVSSAGCSADGILTLGSILNEVILLAELVRKLVGSAEREERRQSGSGAELKAFNSLPATSAKE